MMIASVTTFKFFFVGLFLLLVTPLQSSTDIVCYGSVLFSVSAYYLFLCGIFFCMYSFDNLSFSLGSISNALALPVSWGRHGKLVNNLSHESDVTTLQDPFTSRPYKTPFYFYYCVPRKIPRGRFDGRGPRYSTTTRLQLVGPLTLDAPPAAICLCTVLRCLDRIPGDETHNLLHCPYFSPPTQPAIDNLMLNLRQFDLWSWATYTDTQQVAMLLGAIPPKLDRQHEKAWTLLTFPTCTRLIFSLQSHTRLTQPSVPPVPKARVRMNQLTSWLANRHYLAVIGSFKTTICNR